MSFIGNIILVIATLIFFGLVSLLIKEPRGGDNLMGYAWSVIILNLAFIVCMIVMALIIGSKGGFAWVSENKSNRFLYVTLGLLAALITSALSGLFKYEHGPVPGLIRIYSSFAPFIIPLVLIGAAAILLNSNLQASVPIAIYKYPLLLVSLLGLTGVGSALIDAISQSSRNQIARAEEMRNRDDENHKRMLADIDSCDVMKNMVFILVFTGDNQDPEIREKAVAKVKTNPEWQQELIRLLGTDWAPEPLQFLASNEVDDPALFIEPVRLGVLNQARLIRETIRKSSHPSHFYPEQFTWEVERVLRTVDRYSGKGIDYLPAVKEVRAALNEPSDFDKPKFKCISMLDQWIMAHS